MKRLIVLFSLAGAVALVHEGDATPGRRAAECLGETFLRGME